MMSCGLTAFTLAEQEEFNRLLIPPECCPVLLDLLVNGVADGLSARLVLFSHGFLEWGFVWWGKETIYEWVWGGYDGHVGGRRNVRLFRQLSSGARYKYQTNWDGSVGSVRDYCFDRTYI